MYPKSTKQLKHRAFLRRKFVRKQKKIIDEYNLRKKNQADLEKNNKILGSLLGPTKEKNDGSEDEISSSGLTKNWRAQAKSPSTKRNRPNLNKS